MKKESSISNRIKANIIEAPENAKKTSYSQFNTYAQCPHRWYLKYAKKLFPFDSSIDSVFGTSIHETMQYYLELLYNNSIKASEAFKIYTFFKERLLANYNLEFEKNDNQDFATPEQLNEYYIDGCEILKYVKKNRVKYFDPKNEELLGVEIPIMTPIIHGNDTFFFNGFVDIALYDKVNKTLKMPDFKTSGKGWGDYQKKDELKMAQSLLYKNFFHQQFGIPEDDIEVSFMILKRKLWSESQYPQSRVQMFVPAQGKAKVAQAVNMLGRFVQEAFDWEGNALEKTYKKNPGNACKFCPFNASSELCDQRK